MARRSRPGRKRKAPRERSCVYLSPLARAAISEWRQTERAGGNMSFTHSDALNEMVEIAAYYAPDKRATRRFQPLAAVLNGLHGATIPEHIRVEPNGGRRVRCAHCRACHTIVSRRFSGLLRELTKFVREHEHPDSA
jgi:hypothetical protein